MGVLAPVDSTTVDAAIGTSRFSLELKAWTKRIKILLLLRIGFWSIENISTIHASENKN